MSAFRTINVSRAGIEQAGTQARLRGLNVAPIRPESGAAGPPPPTAPLPTSIEAASRAALQMFLEDAGSETLATLTSPDRPEQIPDMRLRRAGATPDLVASTLTFQQTSAQIPVFGGRVTVDLHETERSFLAINGQIATRPDISPIAGLSPRAAAESLAAWAGTAVEDEWLQVAPVLTWYHDDDQDRWYLTYHFKAIPVTPPEMAQADPHAQFTCLHCAAMPGSGRYSYLVDANDGSVRFFYSAGPRLSVPVALTAPDIGNVQRQIFCESRQNVLVLCDPLRNIETYDYAGGDLSAVPAPALPANPVAVPPSPAAVSAHHHARVVFDFFNDVLKRDGVDDKGMKLVSVVNVQYSQNNADHPHWRNAVWYQGRMWYGGDVPATAGGQSVSLARHLDVIGHELTHGVTETSSGLIYRDLPGALNESFSDIFGVMIANWLPAAPEPVGSWNWEIGPGLGQGGGPIRDMANPARTGQPTHMSQYVRLSPSQDNGGVHIYSGIHNKAVHNLLTAIDPDGTPSFPVGEAALLLYLTLVRLTPTSDFKAARRTFETITNLFYTADPARQARRLAAIAAAYSAVGI